MTPRPKPHQLNGLQRALRRCIAELSSDEEVGTKELAQLTDVNEGTVKGWLSHSDPHAPNVWALVRLASKKKISLNWLLLNRGEMHDLPETGPSDTDTAVREYLKNRLESSSVWDVREVEVFLSEHARILEYVATLIEQAFTEWRRRRLMDIVDKMVVKVLKPKAGSALQSAGQINIKQLMERMASSAD